MAGTATLAEPGALTSYTPAAFNPAAAPALTGTHPDAEREAQRAWAARPLRERLGVLARARAVIAAEPEAFDGAISSELDRTPADTLVAEVLPLLAAVRYLERSAATVLRTRRLRAAGRPVWLGRVTNEIERVPLGRVLIIAPANYPLLLPGVQAVQALAAGNSVIWKPGRGGGAVAQLLRAKLRHAGLADGLLTVTDESVDAVHSAIAEGVDKILFTGSAAAGRAVLRGAAEQAIPCTVELSGADAAIVLPSASLGTVAAALGFGVRLNGSATCMAPRRVLLVDASRERRSELIDRLQREFEAIGPVRVTSASLALAHELLDEARTAGAIALGGAVDAGSQTMTPALVVHGQPSMRIAQTDLFAPVLTIIDVRGEAGVLAAQESCPLALTASIFGAEREARQLASRLAVGHISINDVIVTTADPRVPFGGRKGSGFGVTRGAEGLLDLTAPRVIARRRGTGTRHYERTGEAHAGLFAGLIRLMYGRGLAARACGLQQMTRAAAGMPRPAHTRDER